MSNPAVKHYTACTLSASSCVESSQLTASKAPLPTVLASSGSRSVSATVVQTGPAATSARMPSSATNVSPSSASVCIRSRSVKIAILRVYRFWCPAPRERGRQDHPQRERRNLQPSRDSCEPCRRQIQDALRLRGHFATGMSAESFLLLWLTSYIGRASTKNTTSKSLRTWMECLRLSCWTNP